MFVCYFFSLLFGNAEGYGSTQKHLGMTFAQETFTLWNNLTVNYDAVENYFRLLLLILMNKKNENYLHSS